MRDKQPDQQTDPKTLSEVTNLPWQLLGRKSSYYTLPIMAAGKLISYEEMEKATGITGRNLRIECVGYNESWVGDYAAFINYIVIPTSIANDESMARMAKEDKFLLVRLKEVAKFIAERPISPDVANLHQELSAGRKPFLSAAAFKRGQGPATL